MISLERVMWVSLLHTHLLASWAPCTTVQSQANNNKMALSLLNEQLSSQSCCQEAVPHALLPWHPPTLAHAGMRAGEDAEEEAMGEEEEAMTPRTGAQEEALSQPDLAARNAAFWEGLLQRLWRRIKADEEANGSPVSAADEARDLAAAMGSGEADPCGPGDALPEDAGGSSMHAMDCCSVT